MNKQKILIILATTLVAAIIIIVVFIVLIKRGSPAVPAGYNQYIEDLKKPGGQPGETGTGQKPDEVITYSGTLVTVESGLEGNILTLKDSQTGNIVRFILAADARVIYGAKQLQLGDLHAGDELRVSATKNPDGALAAQEVAVTVSTSPTVPTQVNVPVETPGVILPPSKRNIL